MSWIPDWSADLHLASMDILGIAKSLLFYFVTGRASRTRRKRRRARRAKSTKTANAPRSTIPHGSASSASLPPPDVDASLAEIAYCL